MASDSIYLIDEKYEQSITSSNDIMYVLEDGFLLPVQCRDAYCRHCKSCELVESLPAIHSLQESFTENDRQELQSADSDTPWYRSTFERKRRLEWRHTRVDPPRCLHCGMSDFYLIEQPDSVDQKSGKRIVWKDCIFFDPSLSLAVRLRPDGSVISSWMHSLKRLD